MNTTERTALRAEYSRHILRAMRGGFKPLSYVDFLVIAFTK